MITLEEARSLVEAAINAGQGKEEVAVVLDEETLTRSWGWVFFFQSRRFVETGDLSSALVGNAPLIVEQRSGRLLHTGTAYPTDFYLRNYESTGDPHLQPGPEIELTASSADADRVAAARLLSRTCSLSIGDAVRAVDSVGGGTATRIQAASANEASDVCSKLGALGFTARQIPEPC